MRKFVLAAMLAAFAGCIPAQVPEGETPPATTTETTTATTTTTTTETAPVAASEQPAPPPAQPAALPVLSEDEVAALERRATALEAAAKTDPFFAAASAEARERATAARRALASAPPTRAELDALIERIRALEARPAGATPATPAEAKPETLPADSGE